MSALAIPEPPVSSAGTPLKNHRHEIFAQHLAKGVSAKDAYISAGYSELGADQSASRLLRNAKISLRVAELRLETVKVLHAETVLDKKYRLKCKEQRHLALQQILVERRDDPLVQAVPGGRTGLVILRNIRIVGNKEVPFYGIDIPALQQLTDLEREIAIETGEYNQKIQHEVTGRDGGPITVEVIESMLSQLPDIELDRLLEKSKALAVGLANGTIIDVAPQKVAPEVKSLPEIVAAVPNGQRSPNLGW